VLTEDEWENESRMLERIESVLDPLRQASWEEAAGRARKAPRATLEAMAEATIGTWRDALARAPARVHLQPIATARCLEALHYVAWTPPAPGVPAVAPSTAKPNGALQAVARAALAIRHTLPGRLLYRLAPKQLVQALRQRL
jgi:hypothetical protein